MKRMTAGDLQALELLMQTTPGFEHYDSGVDGILPECRSCRFHRPFWKYQSCVFAECPYCCNPVSTLKNQSGTSDAGKEASHVCFTYEGAENPALDHLSFDVEPGQTVALVGPSGGGKTTAASLIPRFWDVTDGCVEVGGVDVRDADPHVLMNRVAFVFQNTHLFKASILENVRAARPEASREEAEAALQAAQCGDILAKLPKVFMVY